MHKILLSILVLFLSNKGLSQRPYTIENEVKPLMEIFKESINKNDYGIIKPYLSRNFKVEGQDFETGLLTFYSYVNSALAEKIKNISIVEKSKIDDTLIEIKAQILFENNRTHEIIFTFQKLASDLQIKKISSYQPPGFTMVTRASYVNQQIFRDNPIENIENLKILDVAGSDFINKGGYTIYYDIPALEKNAKDALHYFNMLDEFLISNFGFKEIEKENLLLTSKNSPNTVVIGKTEQFPGHWHWPNQIA